MNELINPNKVVVFTGPELTQDCGTPNHRTHTPNGKHRLANYPYSPYAWQQSPAQVIATYNELKQYILAVEPNESYLAIAQLEHQYDVTVITQNIDDLHERSGSTDVRHLHGDITQAMSPTDQKLLIDIGYNYLSFNSNSTEQLRPNIVSYGERTYWQAEARSLISSASIVLAIGVSFDLLPTIHLLRNASIYSERYLLSTKGYSRLLQGYQKIREPFSESVPRIIVGLTR
ncbi:hypothetical protein DBZ36_01200 [Alginatibacterium sediminis]|uniref:protein acetyllysine N-acetyltransferase n=1 Tax=Alginatibacterium sediminis TaxID=2164068 RepID=A0A420ENQ7_9ALTE|nr:Sir2 family NAD-dependent protein deacetylase [Alginatibacterium sediminis]RKF22293.1 hypothetical protein DBZ36_01200 [Alginatibacterium sediminis]